MDRLNRDGSLTPTSTSRSPQGGWHVEATIAGALFVAAYLLRAYNLVNTLVMQDEVYYQSYAFAIIGNNWLWPVDFMLVHPPLFPYLEAITTLLFAGELVIFRHVSVIASSLTVVVIYFLGKEMFDRPTGAAAALFLAFQPFFLVEGRYAILEPTLIFFMYLSLYAFWKGYVKSGSLKDMTLAGLFLGLAFDVKYAAFLLYPTYAAFIIWHKRSLRSLLDRRVLLAFAVSLAAVAPVLLALQSNDFLFKPLNYILVQRKMKPSITGKPHSLADSIVLGLSLYVNTITGYPSTETSSLPWLPLFQFATYVLAPIVVLYFLTGLFRKRPAEAFPAILFVIFNGFIMLALPHRQTYLTWTLPAFDLMLAWFAVLLFRKLRSANPNHWERRSILTPIRLAGLLLVGIMLFSTVVAGSAAPIVDRGGLGYVDMDGFLNAAQFIKNRATEGDIVLADNTAQGNIRNFVILSEDSEFLFGRAHSDLLFNKTDQQIQGEWFRVKTLRIDLIEQYKPRFLLINSVSYFWISKVEWKSIYGSYRLAFHNGSWTVFECIVPPEKPQRTSPPISGNLIQEDLSFASVPPIVIVGEAYFIDLWVINNGAQTNTYEIQAGGPQLYFLFFESVFTLAPNIPRHVEIGFVPQVPDVSSTITIKLLLRSGSLPADVHLQDMVSKDVRVKPAFSTEAILTTAILLSGAVAVLLLVIRRRNGSKRLICGKPASSSSPRMNARADGRRENRVESR